MQHPGPQPLNACLEWQPAQEVPIAANPGLAYRPKAKEEARPPKVESALTYDHLDDVPWSIRERLAMISEGVRAAVAEDGPAQSVAEQAVSLGLATCDASPIVPCAEPRVENENGARIQGCTSRSKNRAGERKEPSMEPDLATSTRGAKGRPAKTEQRQHGMRRQAPHRQHRGYDIRSRHNRGRSRHRRTTAQPQQQVKPEESQQRDIQTMTWNVGGMPTDRMTEMVDLLPALGLGQVEVLALQEVSCPPGITELTAGKGQHRWHLVAGKESTEWRGRMIAIRESFGKIVHKEMAANGIGVTVRTLGGKIGVLNVHLPPKATLPDTGKQTTVWADMQAMKHTKAILLGDLNETFIEGRVNREDWSTLQHKTARGAMLLQWLGDQDMQPPAQELGMPTYHPYNRLHRPRRLDYVFFRGVQEGAPGKVHQLRHLASSDHDAVTASVRVRLTHPDSRSSPPTTQHGAKQLKEEEEVQKALQQSKAWRGDRMKHLQNLALSITETRKNPFRYVESREIKQLRMEAMRKRRTPEGRALWKEVWRKKKQHKEAWHRELLHEVLRNNWHALQAAKRSRKPAMWVGDLTEGEGWQKRMKTHFESIFKQQERGFVRGGVQAAWKRMEGRCKEVPWEPFTCEELATAMGKWKGGKSTGPDGIPFEALKVLYRDDQWKYAILQELNDALYKGRLPRCAKESVTILIPKEPAPKQWSATRPITLSTSFLKWQSQLILARTTEHIFRGAHWQYAQPGKQPAELILSIRKAVRTCREWQLPLHLIKVDVAKAFDTASQTHLAALVERQVGERGERPWEARAWIDMLANEVINVAVEKEVLEVEQTNGVRQGSPDSPVAFAALIGQVLNEVLGPPPRSANPTPPNPMTTGNGTSTQTQGGPGGAAPDGGPPMPSNGGSFQDDIYLWGHDKEKLQEHLRIMVKSLGARNLQVNAAKTKYVHNQEGKQVLKIGNVEVEGDKDGSVTVLGSPIAMAGEVMQILAEVARRARGSFALHKKLLTGAGSIDHKMLAYTRYVATSALWAIGAAHPHDSLLKGINSIQLLQLRQVFRIKRTALEPWDQWHQRSLRQARVYLASRPAHRWSAIALTQVWRLWGHAARNNRDTGLMLGWRNQEWWRAEQGKPRGLRHPHRFNAMLETEKLIEKTVMQWREAAQDRAKWKELEPTFVRKYDPPWSSGKQTSLSNLAPN